MIHLGDITKINGAKIEPVDCICFGSPCQDLSIAGNRNGLDGERSGLFTEAVRVIKEMRNATAGEVCMRGSDESIRPRFAIWENVPGAFSSNKGQDFRTVLEELVHIKQRDCSIPMPKKGKWAKSGFINGDGWSIAWRQMDAQFWGVPQRRKRIALLVDFDGDRAAEILLCDDFKYIGETNDGTGEPSSVDIRTKCESEVLLKHEGLQGNLKPCIEAWKGIARNPEESVGVSSEYAYTLLLRHTGSDVKGGGAGPLINENISSTLNTQKDQTLFR